MLRFADLAIDVELLDWARQLAPCMLDQHPALAERHVSAGWVENLTFSKPETP